MDGDGCTTFPKFTKLFKFLLQQFLWQVFLGQVTDNDTMHLWLSTALMCVLGSCGAGGMVGVSIGLGCCAVWQSMDCVFTASVRSW